MELDCELNTSLRTSCNTLQTFRQTYNTEGISLLSSSYGMIWKSSDDFSTGRGDQGKSGACVARLFPEWQLGNQAR